MENEISESRMIKIMKYAIECHSSTNHLYDGAPYVIHLSMVVNTAVKFIDAIPDQCQSTVVAACWLHDVIEDCRVTYNDVKAVAGEEVAEIVYACTTEKGKTRSERANEKYYAGIKRLPWATFVKLCDRIANVQYSKLSCSRMFVTYRKENDHFLEMLKSSPHYNLLVEELNKLLSKDTLNPVPLNRDIKQKR